MDLTLILKSAGVFLVSISKFLIGLPSAKYAHDLDFWGTVSYGIGSSTVGIIIFTYLGEGIQEAWNWVKKKITGKETVKKDPKDGWVGKIITRFGLWGLAFITPVIISIPIGTFLGVSVYKSPKRVLIHMIPMGWLWSFILALLLELFPTLFGKA